MNQLIDHEIIANTALKSKLNKDRILSGNEHVLAAVSKEKLSTLIPAAAGTPASKIQSRLLSSKILAEEVATVLEHLKNALHPKAKDDLEMTEEDIHFTHPKKLRQPPGDETDSVPPGSREGQRNYLSPGGGRDGVIATEEADEIDWESGTVGDDEKDVDDGWGPDLLTEERDGSDEEDSEDVDSEGSGVEPPANKPSGKVATSKPRPPARVTGKSSVQQSTFLPSLSVGFTRGEPGDSDMSESEVKAGDIELKKNRRGQRARRA